MRIQLIISTLSLLIFPVVAFSWDGYDYETGNYIEIGQENLVRTGNDIEIYDYDDGSYKDVEVTGINRWGNSVEIEVYDWESGDYRTFEMDGR